MLNREQIIHDLAVAAAVKMVDCKQDLNTAIALATGYAEMVSLLTNINPDFFKTETESD